MAAVPNADPSSTDRPVALALTMGEPAGIGPEITIKSWLRRGDEALPPFIVYGDPSVLAAAARALDVRLPIAEVTGARDAASVFATALPVHPIRLRHDVRFGSPDVGNASAVIAAIEAAVTAAMDGTVLGIVTNPIAKAVLKGAGFGFPGHTEFLGALAERHTGRTARPVMMLAATELRVVPLTIHVALKDVPGLITAYDIIETADIMSQALSRDFGIPAPRIAIAGLNPHAGESGTMGSEDAEIIASAIGELEARGITVTGPHPADTLFHAAARQRYDAVLAMYHDQALIPIKTLAFDRGVNVTLGLPFVRTSPDHGTAFDIAGQGRANAQSLIEALRLAADIGQRRRCTGA